MTSPRKPVTLGDLLAEYAGRFEGETLEERTQHMIDSLTPKEREVLRARFALNTDPYIERLMGKKRDG